MNKVILYAPNIHKGGGLVLLKSLIEVWPENICLHAYFDERAADNLVLPKNSQIFWVKRNIFSRIKAEMSLSNTSCENDLVVLKNSLPPLFKCRAKTVIFMQNRNFVEKISLSKFKINQAIQIMIERTLSYLLRYRVDEYIVQTDSFKRSIENWYTKNPSRKPTIKVLPFMKLLELDKLSLSDNHNYDFIYVADGLAQKNHDTLFYAWEELATQGIYPSLALTLDSLETDLISKINRLQSKGIKITNLGSLSHNELLQKYQECRALIYPSLRESFGLTLVEASMLDLPILASELDYVYDVCSPNQTFDPNSFRSIARTVNRFLGISESVSKVNPPSEFLDYIFSSVTKNSLDVK